MKSSTVCPQNSKHFPCDIHICNIDVISSLFFYEETFIANAVIYDMFEQNFEHSYLYCKEWTGLIWNLPNYGEAITTTCFLNGKHIQALFASGYCQSLCLYVTNWFCRERFLCHHCVAFIYRVLSLVTANTPKSTLFRLYVNCFIVGLQFSDNIKCGGHFWHPFHKGGSYCRLESL